MSQHWAGAQDLLEAMEEPEVVNVLESIKGRRKSPTLTADKNHD